MTNPPLNRDTDDDPGVEPGLGATNGTSLPRRVVTTWQKVVGIIGIVVILWVGNQMFDNFFPSGPGSPGTPGPGGHGPGGDTPVENQEQDTDTEDDGDMHDPSQRDHG